MRLLTFMAKDGPRPGALVGEEVIDLRALLPGAAWRDARGMIAAGPQAWAGVTAALARLGTAARVGPVAELQLLPPITDPGKLIAIGVNYEDHLRETGHPRPTSPVVFAKFDTSLNAPGGEIRWDPALTSQVDWEVELAVVIGQPARRVAAADAYEYVFGYTVANDVSARDLQFADRQWVRGKSLDSFCPLGPWIVSRDEIPDPHGLAIRTLVNDEVVQDANTDQLVFGVPQLIEYLSAAFTLLPGDIILTGTPAGVGHYRNPPRYLHDGDRVVVEIESIGRLENVCQEERP